MNTHFRSVIEQAAIEIIGEDELPRIGDFLYAVRNNVEWCSMLARKLGKRYIVAIKEFEQEFTCSLDLSNSKEIAIAKKEGMFPCIDKNDKKHIAIWDIKSLGVDAFGAFDDYLYVSEEVYAAFVPISLGLQANAAESKAKEYALKILEAAYETKANDIHIEPYSGGYQIRFAISDNADNVAYSVGQSDFMDKTIAVFQNMAGVDVRSSKPFQDGQISVDFKGKKTQWRYHEDKTIVGKRVVIRQAYPFVTSTTLESLNYVDSVCSLVRRASRQKQGMILFTGTTGQGKSTGMTALLLELHKKFKWFITMIEDNPEVMLDGISQIKISSVEGEFKYGYSEAIKASLRADIDVLMVAEIRDISTAMSAYQAAMTGHLAFSTLHVGRVLDVIDRLKGVGVDSYTVAAYTSAIVAQKLINSLCPACKIPTQDERFPFKRAKNGSCKTCGGKGYYERVPINECAELKMDGRVMSTIDDFKTYISFEETLLEQARRGLIDEETYLMAKQETK